MTDVFENKYYKAEWKENVPNTNQRYADGTYAEEPDKFAVYDGATNYIGYIDKRTGNFWVNGDPNSEYNCSFLKAAKEVLVKKGLVFSL